MSTPKHTPGPWRIIDSRDQSKATIVGSDFPDMGFVADVNLCRNNTHQQVDGRANAALIAAAPVMYEALRMLTSEINLSTLNVRKDFSLMNAHACAVKAILQAEGKLL